MRSLLLLLFCFPLVCLSQTFSASTILGVNNTIGSTSVSDYDNDVNDDLLVSGKQMNLPVLHLYKIANGTSLEIINSGLPQQADYAQWVNYNNDNWPDAYVVNYTPKESILTFYINSNGTFSPRTVTLPKIAGADFSVVDYDSDGDLDILMAGIDAGTFQVHLFKNNAGIFSKVSSGLQSSTKSLFTWGDFDNDKDLDVIISTYSSSWLYANNGGTFSPVKTDFPGVTRGKVMWADFDNDKDLDLLITGYSSSGSLAKIFTNTGNNTFATYAGVTLQGTEQGFSQWIDYDKDGDLDLFHSGITSSGSSISQLYELNNGTYTQINSLGLPTNGSFAFVDYDKDNDYDMFIPDNSFVSRIFRNNLKTNPYPVDGTPAWPTNLVAYPNSTTGIQLNWSDYANNESYFSIEMKSGAGSFLEISVLPANTTSYNVTGLTAGTIYSFRIRSGNASGYSRYSEVIISSPASPDLVKLSTIPSIYQLLSSSWADMDNDGDLDLIYSGFGDATVNYAPQTIILKNNAGVFASQAHNLPTIEASDLDWTDFDFDGDLDLLLCGSPPGAVNAQTKVFLNNGNFNFTEYTQVSLKGVRSGFARWADLNGDGFSDIFLSGTVDPNSATHASQLLINNGKNTFNEKTNSGLPTFYQGDVEIGDFNKDGRLDLLISGIKDTVSVSLFASSELYLNNGDNTFAFTQSFQSSADGSVDASDLDGDGDLDIIIGGNLLATKIYWNNLGKFTEDTKNQIIGFQYGHLTIGDLDNDGDSDIILGGNAGRNTAFKSTVYLNNGTGLFSEGYYPLSMLSGVSFSLGDYDQDGDLDLFEGGNNYFGSATIFKNQAAAVNSKPSAPSILRADPLPGAVKLVWTNGSDDKTPSKSLTANVFVKDSNGKYLFDGIVDPSNGNLRTPRKGMFLNDSVVLKGFSPGIYQVGLQNVDNSFKGSSFATKSVTIGLIAPNLLSVNPSVCEGTTANIEVFGNSVVWYKDGLLSDSIAGGNMFHPLLKKSDSTFYAVQKYGSTKGPSLAVTVKVYRQVNSKITSATDGLIAPDGTSYQWFRNDSLLVAATSKKITTAIPGRYRLNISNGPCAAVDTLTYLLRPAVPAVTFSSKSCVNDAKQFSANGINIIWYNRSGSQIGTGNLFSINKVTLADTVLQLTQTVNTVSSLKMKLTWTLSQYPDSTVAVKDGTLTAPPASSYQWFKNGIEIPGATSREFNLTSEGVYYVNATNGICTTKSEKMVILSVQETDDVMLIQDIYNSQLFIRTSSKIFNQIGVFDSTGKIIVTKSDPAKSIDGYHIDVPNLSPGLYVINALSGTDSYVFRAKFIRISH